MFPPVKLSWEIHSHLSKCTLYDYYYYHYYIVKHTRFTRHGSDLYITSVTVTAPIIVIINLHQYILYETIKITVIFSYYYFTVT